MMNIRGPKVTQNAHIATARRNNPAKAIAPNPIAPIILPTGSDDMTRNAYIEIFYKSYLKITLSECFIVSPSIFFVIGAIES